MNEDDLLPAFERVLAEAAPLSFVRAVEEGGDITAGWAVLEESGFLDLLVPEEAGGAGLSLQAASLLIEALGSSLFPAPVAQTIAARGLLAQAGIEAPEGPILLAAAPGGQTQPLPFSALATHALVASGHGTMLLPVSPDVIRPTGLHGSRTASLCWNGTPETVANLTLTPSSMRALCATLRAAEMAGMAAKLLDMTVTYANTRVQFGKPIGRQQAIQQQLAVMAEQVMLTRIAARLGCAGGMPPALEAAAAAKYAASSAVPHLTGIAHAVHGAIGISEEYDLQLYTRRLHEWRLADGGEAYWAKLLGTQRLASSAATSVAFVQSVSPV